MSPAPPHPPRAPHPPRSHLASPPIPSDTPLHALAPPRAHGALARRGAASASWAPGPILLLLLPAPPAPGSTAAGVGGVQPPPGRSRVDPRPHPAAGDSGAPPSRDAGVGVGLDGSGGRSGGGEEGWGAPPGTPPPHPHHPHPGTLALSRRPLPGAPWSGREETLVPLSGLVCPRGMPDQTKLWPRLPAPCQQGSELGHLGPGSSREAGVGAFHRAVHGPGPRGLGRQGCILRALGWREARTRTAAPSWDESRNRGHINGPSS